MTHQAPKIREGAGEVRSASDSTNTYDVDTAAMMNKSTAAARNMGGVATT